QIYQRMLTYTLNKIVKTAEIALLLSVGLILTGAFVTTPTLIVLLLFTNDFVTMAIATDRVTSPRSPQRWHVRALVVTAVALAVLILLLSFSILFVGRDVLRLPLAQLQTLIFIMLVFSGQGTVYLVRERRHFWNSMPSRWLLLSSGVDILIVSLLATHGILMAPVSGTLVVAVLALVAVYLAAVDFVKIGIVRYLRCC
ncbi:MAG: plasma-membrane proton-efflux P-type ATPase, partial [Phycisphaerae bacterium]